MPGANESARRVLRQPSEYVSQVLDKLDTNPPTGRVKPRRGTEREAYRALPLEVEILETSSRNWVSYLAAARNLSPTGIAFLIGQFVYPGTECRVYLVDRDNQRITHGGRIVRCRYLAGTARLHEVGVQFESPIDLTHYLPRPSTNRTEGK